MPKEVFSQIIANKQYLVLVVITGVFLLSWIVTIMLGLLINRYPMNWKKIIFPWSVIGVIYSLFAKSFIPDYFFFFTTLLLLTVLLKIITKQGIGKVFFAALLSLMAAIFSFFLLGQPLLINDDFKIILLSKPWGIIIGSLLEIVLTTSIIFVLRYRRTAKQDKTSFFGVTGYMLVLLVIYCLFAVIFYFLANYHAPALSRVIITEIALIGVTLFMFIRLQNYVKREEQRCEENHSTYLLKTILSKQREYRNFFQVIRAMAEAGKTREIIDYIDDIFVEMSFVETFNEENPIFTSLQVAEQIKAKEKGVIITSATKADLTELREPVRVYEIFRDLLQFFVAYEEAIVSDRHTINIEVSEDDQHYSFMIMRKTEEGERSVDPIVEEEPRDQDQTLLKNKKRIKQLHGKFYCFYKGEELIGCLFKVGKAKRKQLLFSVGF